MSTSTIKDTVTYIVTEHLCVTEAEVTPEKTFAELGADSLDHVELMMALEDEFGIEISEGDGDNITTAQKAIDYITKVKS